MTPLKEPNTSIPAEIYFLSSLVDLDKYKYIEFMLVRLHVEDTLTVESDARTLSEGA